MCCSQGRKCGIRVVGPDSSGVPADSGCANMPSSSSNSSSNKVAPAELSQAQVHAAATVHAIRAAVGGVGASLASGPLVVMEGCVVKDCGEAGVHASGE